MNSQALSNWWPVTWELKNNILVNRRNKLKSSVDMSKAWRLVTEKNRNWKERCKQEPIVKQKHVNMSETYQLPQTSTVRRPVFDNASPNFSDHINKWHWHYVHTCKTPIHINLCIARKIQQHHWLHVCLHSGCSHKSDSQINHKRNAWCLYDHSFSYRLVDGLGTATVSNYI